MDVHSRLRTESHQTVTGELGGLLITRMAFEEPNRAPGVA